MLKIAKIVLISTFLALFFLSFAEAQIIYVDDDNINGPWDGTYNNPYQHIQDGINAASTADTIIVKPGLYRESVDVNKGLTVQSQKGLNETIVESPSSGSHRVFNVIANNVVIQGFTVKNGENGIYTDSVSNCSISNNYLTNNNRGIHAAYSQLTIRYNQFNSNSCGIYATNSHLTIRDNQLTSNGSGVFIWESGGTISNNSISGHGDYGIGVSHSQGNQISGNTITSNNSGVFIDYSGLNNINNNTVNSNSIGINIWRSTNNTVAGNTIQGNNQMGINLYESSDHNISGNTVKNTTIHGGIHVHDSSHNNTIENNVVSENTYGIFIESHNNTINNNKISNNTFGIRNLSNNNTTVVNNTVSNNVTGISLHFASDSNIAGNQIKNNDDGISLEGSNYNNTISGNTINNNNDSGIWLSVSSQNMITDNTIESNVNWGINIDHSNDNTVKSNIIQYNGTCGVQVYYSNENLIYNNRFLNNVCNACDANNNYWNIEKQSGTNIIGGAYLGGNSWSDYSGRDTNNDGLGDTLLPHTSSGGIQNGGDQHPLVQAGSNNPPFTPNSPSPAEGSIYQNNNANLSWDGGDPDTGDTVTYDVYFGDSLPLPLVSQDQPGTTYDPGMLQDQTTYFWKIVAKDSLFLISEGPEWNFTADINIVLSFLFENEGSVIADVSGNGNDGTVNGAAFLSGCGVLNTNAYQFSWSNQDNIQVPYQETQTVTGALTLEAWIYPTAWDNIYSGYNRIVSKQPVYLLRGADGYAQFQILTENHSYQCVIDSEILGLNEWHYVVGTFNGHYLRLYVDGILKDSLELPEEDSISTNEMGIFVGESPGLNEGFTGIIDNLAIYKRARLQSEIEETYTSIMLRCEGDFDDDEDVDGSDLAVFAADFGRTDCASAPECEGDFDGDGDVDGSDLAVFAADFGRTDCP